MGRGGLPGLTFVLALALSWCVALGPAQAQGEFLPGLDDIEFRESFKAGTEGNAIVFGVKNTTAFPVEGLNLRPEMPGQYLMLDRVAPNNIDLAPGDLVEITVEFSVREDAPGGAEDVIGFHFDTVSESDVPMPRYRMIAVIEAEEQAAQCNSAVEAGGDEGGGVTVYLGDFAGLAGFTWEMYTVKDQMNVSVGGVTKTTGCVSGSGTFEFEIPPGAGSARVEVVPNCEGTTGTQWEFTFECPLSSEVTADVTGSSVVPDGGVLVTSSGSGPLAPSATGMPVTPAPPVPPAILPTGQRLPEAEPNGDRVEATPIDLGDAAVGAIATRGDHDFYRFATQHQGELTVGFPSVPPGLDMAFRVLDKNGAQVWGWQSAPAPGQTFAAWADLRRPGIYFIEVADGHSDASAPQTYRMQTSFIATADPAEPNDDRASATELAWNAEMAANILPKGEHDFYRVHADWQGQLSLRVTETPANLNMAFRVLDENGAQVWGWQSAPDLGQTFEAWADIKTPGTYFIEVADGHDDARSAVPYRVFAALDPTADPAEPNDDRAAATPLAPGQSVSGAILPKGDADFYWLDLADQGQLDVSFLRAPANLNMAFRVLTENGAQHWGWQTAPAHGAPFEAWVDIGSPGIYFIEVRDGHNDARSKDSYDMRIAFTATADPSEPNDDRATAMLMDANGSVAAAILPKGDTDVYRLDLSRQGELTAHFTAMPANLNMAFRVLDQNGAQVWGWQSAPEAGEAFAAWADIETPGTYYLEVRDGHNDARSKDPYTLQLAFAATADPAEPNDERLTATPLGFGQPVQAAILPKGDADVYRLDLSRQGELTAHFTAMPANLNMAFRVLDQNGAQVWGWQSAPEAGEAFAAWADIETPGTYYLEVRDGHNDARSKDPYTLQLAFAATADPAEPNDERLTATPLGFGQPVQAAILPKGDADFYRLDIARSGRITAHFTASPDNLDMAVRVLNADGAQVWGWQSAPDASQPFAAEAEVKAPGVYFLEVRDGHNDGRSVAPYTLTATFQ